MSAHGNVAMAPNRALNGRVTVNLTSTVVGGAVGVPLVVGGTLESPDVTLSRNALLGAALGAVGEPRAGSSGKLGDRLGEGLKGLLGK
ncbi:MAG: hypothetical protein H0X13_18480 [Ramlibacter sp.]|nr:hypothetical protein [Ramlibacter sp.]